MWGSAPFEITETVDGGVVRLAVAGELDLATRGKLERRLLELSSRAVPVRLDLSKLEFIDASAVDTLLSAVAGKAPVAIEDTLAPEVSRMLATCGLKFA